VFQKGAFLKFKLNKKQLVVTCVSPKFTFTTQLFYAKHSRFKQPSQEDIIAASTAGAIWSEFMQSLLKIKPEIFTGEIPRPAGILEVKVDIARGCRTDTGITIPFKVGTEPKYRSEITDVSESLNSEQNVYIADT
jgi:hypothetical protein